MFLYSIYSLMSGTLLRKQPIPMVLEHVMMNHGLLEEDAANAGAFIRACLQLDQNERPSAKELVGHPWVRHDLPHCDCCPVYEP